MDHQYGGSYGMYIEEAIHPPVGQLTASAATMMKLAVVSFVVVIISYVSCDKTHVRIRIHLPQVKHHVHHQKTVYEHIKKHKHKLSHHSYHHHEDDVSYDEKDGWNDSYDGDEEESEYDDGHEHQDDEDYSQDWKKK